MGWNAGLYLCVLFAIYAAPAHAQEAMGAPSPAAPSVAKKWIVITSVRPTTEAVRKLAELPGWRVVVVADKATPLKFDVPDGVDFLSLEAQTRLNFSITKLLPFDSYSRKNLGYLWAMQHGGKTIYECDDDTWFEGNHTVWMLPKEGEVSMYVVDDKQAAINVYPTFGQESLWPRGFPLERVRDSPPRHLRRSTSRPYIQQGLTKNSADVDALYRITQGDGLNFTTGLPVAIPSGSFVPLNSRNTVFRWTALWALLLPSTPTARVADVWRGYWAQRLLHDLGAHAAVLRNAAVRKMPLGFEPAALLHNVQLQRQLFRDAGRLVEFLAQWSGETATLAERMVELAKDMAKMGFWANADVALVQAWIKDLDQVGYTWPALAADPSIGDVPMPNLAMPAMFTDKVDLPPRQFFRVEKIILVVVHTHEVSDNVARTLDRMYRAMFAKVVHTGYVRTTPIPDILWEDCQPFTAFRGSNLDLWQECHAAAMQRHLADSHGGYLIIQSDALFNPCILDTLDPNTMWVAYPAIKQDMPKEGIGQQWLWRQRVDGNRTLEDAVRAAVHSLREASHVLHFNATQEFGITPDGTLRKYYMPLMSSVYYLPTRHRADFIALAMHFSQEHVFTEVALAYILGTMLPVVTKGWSHIKGELLQSGAAFPQSFLNFDGMVDGRFWLANVDPSQYLPNIAKWWTKLQCPD